MFLLVRNATLKYHLIIGGASRLFSHAVSYLKEKGVERIITFANGDFSKQPQDCLYSRLGFNYEGDVGGTLFYLPEKDIFDTNSNLVFKANVLINRQRLMKSKLSKCNGYTADNKSFFEFDPFKSEQDNLSMLSITKFRTKGCYKFVYKL